MGTHISWICRRSIRKKEIRINGKLICGYWVYGYVRPQGDLTYIIGGKDIESIGNTSDQHLVINDSVCRCTGLLTPTTDKFKKPLFQYDVIKIVKPKEVDNLIVIWDAVRMRWSALDFDSAEYLYKLTADLAIEVVGNIFDSEYNKKLKSRKD
jgi:hypothetical protein